VSVQPAPLSILKLLSEDKKGEVVLEGKNNVSTTILDWQLETRKPTYTLVEDVWIREVLQHKIVMQVTRAGGAIFMGMCTMKGDGIEIGSIESSELMQFSLNTFAEGDIIDVRVDSSAQTAVIRQNESVFWTMDLPYNTWYLGVTSSGKTKIETASSKTMVDKQKLPHGPGAVLFAAKQKWADLVVDLLIRGDVNLEFTDGDGLTAFDWIRKLNLLGGVGKKFEKKYNESMIGWTIRLKNKNFLEHALVGAEMSEEKFSINNAIVIVPTDFGAKFGDDGSVKETKSYSSMVPLLYAVENKWDEGIEFIVSKYGKAIDANIGNGNINVIGYSFNRTAFTVACAHHYFDCIRILGKYCDNMDVNIADEECGYTFLNIAASVNQLELAKTLLELKQIQIEKAKNFGSTAWHLASYNGSLSIVQLLVKKGADVNKCDNDGVTPVMGAATHGKLEIVQYLWEKSDTTIQDNVCAGCIHHFIIQTSLFCSIGRKHCIGYCKGDGTHRNDQVYGEQGTTVTPHILCVFEPFL